MLELRSTRGRLTLTTVILGSGIAMLDIPKNVLRWNREAKPLAKKKTKAAIAKVNAIGDRVNEWVYGEAKSLLDKGKLAVTLGGGYAEDVADTVAIHAETVRAAARLEAEAGDAPDGGRGAAADRR